MPLHDNSSKICYSSNNEKTVNGAKYAKIHTLELAYFEPFAFHSLFSVLNAMTRESLTRTLDVLHNMTGESLTSTLDGRLYDQPLTVLCSG